MALVQRTFRDGIMWLKEQKIIDGLAKLYPVFQDNCGHDIRYNVYKDTCYGKSYWLTALCLEHLNARIPRLEYYIKYNDRHMWGYYKRHFGLDK